MSMKKGVILFFDHGAVDSKTSTFPPPRFTVGLIHCGMILSTVCLLTVTLLLP